MPHVQPLILAAILIAAIQAEARHAGLGPREQVVPVSWLSMILGNGSPCTGVELNIGCVPVEMMGLAGE
jgi:hypothetical protein